MFDLATQSRTLAPSPAAAGLRSLAPLALGLLVAGLFQFVGPRLGPFHATLLLNVGIHIVLAVSLNIVNGFTGQLSLGHAGMMAVGGYSAAAMTYYSSLHLWGNAQVHSVGGYLLFAAALLVGGLVAAAAGYLVGLPSLRLRGDYLAIVTLGFGEIVRVLLQQTGPVLYEADDIAQRSWWQLATHVGGAVGMSSQPRYTNLFWVYAAVALVLIAAVRIKYSSLGRAFLAIRENEIAAQAMGIPVTRYKVYAFVLAAFFAGIAGGLYAHAVPLVPAEMAFQKSIDLAIIVVLGGMGSISGAVLAATVLTLLPEVVRDFREYSLLVYAVVMIVIMIFRPQGLLGIYELWDLKPVRAIVKRLRRQRS